MCGGREHVAVSVIIPAYNTAQYIAEALDSVFAQTFRDFEVIVVNDGSPDTERLEHVLAPYLDRIIYLKQENRGPSAARNLGISRAQGELLTFLDSDDIWAPEYLARQIDFLMNGEPKDMVYCDAWFFGHTPSAGKTLMELYPSQSGTVTFETLVRAESPMIFTHCVVLRRQLFVNVGGFDETLTHSEDLHLWLRVALAGARIECQCEALAGRRARPGSLNSARHKVERGLIDVLNKIGHTCDLSPLQRSLLEERIARFEAAVYLRKGKESLGNGQLDDARAFFSSANRYLRRWKLRLVLAGLRYAPHITRSVATAWSAIDTSARRVRQSLKSSLAPNRIMMPGRHNK